jgi:hypothetical protein
VSDTFDILATHPSTEGAFRDRSAMRGPEALARSRPVEEEDLGVAPGAPRIRVGKPASRFRLGLLPV